MRLYKPWKVVSGREEKGAEYSTKSSLAATPISAPRPVHHRSIRVRATEIGRQAVDDPQTPRKSLRQLTHLLRIVVAKHRVAVPFQVDVVDSPLVARKFAARASLRRRSASRGKGPNRSRISSCHSASSASDWMFDSFR